MNVLSEIIAKKRQRVAQAKELVAFDVLRDQAVAKRTHSKPRALREALQNEGVNIIAEFKRRSPSKGVIRANADLSSIVRSYETGGAAALSILTEEDYFDGSLADLREARNLVDLPLLRKDFVLDEYQVYESAVAGADAILLIVSVLDDRQLESLRRVAEEDLGMDALVEVHDAQEMDRAAGSGATLIGVNNRNLRTFEVSLETSVRLAPHAPRDALLVSESGLRESADLRRLREEGFNGFLVGESLIRAPDPGAALRNLKS
jgi:indole-3-glycerol phosphate synthase